ncbi:NAD-dependent epimerase/dehydratase family protein [Kitasatospora sp. NPDC006697]|uniref:NAD-dependent epimerase/dehydratase family protein n=1 Tax=Kitasatospora sp. NPDC006697 TaxID=3364020 RepID=UPI0036C97350
MHVFLAGGTGAIGRLLLPLLRDAGHRVTATTRTEAGAGQLRAAGAAAVRLDVFDRAAVTEAVRAAAPEAVIHQLTALADYDFAANARIRREGTRNLVDAARAAGVRRIVAQSISWGYQGGDTPADEATPLDPDADRAALVGSLRVLESAAAELPEHVVLRYGMFYGPGTWYTPGGLVEERLRRGEVTAGPAVTSWLHVTDAARAAVAALDWPSGVVNVTDDEPAAAAQWVPALAAALGLPAPAASEAPRQPWERGADNSYARKVLGWEPVHPSWREGFARHLG